jgi:membrane protease YdiL (CAAX protease family)
MNFFAAAFPSARNWELPILIGTVFFFYTLVSFIRVLDYSLKQVRAGKMIDNPNSPMRVKMFGSTGWIFAGCVLLLLFSQSGLYLVLVMVGMTVFLQKSGRTASEQFGYQRLTAKQLLKWSILICGAVIFIELPLSEVIDWLMSAMQFPHPEQQTVETFRHYYKPGPIVLFMVEAVVISPLIEELFFRGFLFSFLKNYTSTGLAIVLSGGVFAFAHVNLGSALQLWILGIVLGLAYEHTGSLLLPIGIHACWNLLTALSLLLEKGNL